MSRHSYFKSFCYCVIFLAPLIKLFLSLKYFFNFVTQSTLKDSTEENLQSSGKQKLAAKKSENKENMKRIKMNMDAHDHFAQPEAKTPVLQKSHENKYKVTPRKNDIVLHNGNFIKIYVLCLL